MSDEYVASGASTDKVWSVWVADYRVGAGWAAENVHESTARRLFGQIEVECATGFRPNHTNITLWEGDRIALTAEWNIP